MKLIVISHPSIFPNEHLVITSLFENNLEIFHIHKPNFSKQEIQNYIQQFSEKYRSRIFLHFDFPKFHSLQELEASSLHGGLGRSGGEYAFLSPIFDSISKAEHKSKFSTRLNQFIQVQPELTTSIKGKNIIALGGIDEDKIDLARKLGFTGVAVLGAIWNSKDPVWKFKRIKAICEKKILSA